LAATSGASRALHAALIAAAVAPWIPDILAFIREGVPDPVYAGDGAALEFGVLHALHGDQLLGPYSRFGWSHPGPAMFYLAAPFYAAFSRHAASLHLFAFVVNIVSALAIVRSVRLLNGALAGLVTAAFLAVFTTVAAPFLPTNVWNPILPMLPLALAFCLAARIARGEERLLPLFAAIASAMVQAHVGYGPAVLALWASAMILRRRWRSSADLDPTTVIRTRWLTCIVLLLCWALPLYEAATTSPGNLQLLTRFFVSTNVAQQSWGLSLMTVTEQLAVAPLSFVRLLLPGLATPSTAVLAAIALGEMAMLIVICHWGVRRREPHWTITATLTIILILISVLAVRAIRGDVHFHLVAWIAVVGLIACLITTGWLVARIERVYGARGRVAVVTAAALAIGLTMQVPRAPVIGPSDPGTERLARDVEVYLRTERIARPILRIVTQRTWPSAIGITLFLYKQGVPIAVDPEWRAMVGGPLAEGPNDGNELLIIDADTAKNMQGATYVASAGEVYVLARRSQMPAR
jgi:hypothetical protein